MPFNLFSSRNKNKKRYARGEDFRNRRAEEEAAMAPVVAAVEKYDAELGRNKPKEFWTERTEIRISLGKRKREAHNAIYEEVIWANYDIDQRCYKISIFRGVRGENKKQETSIVKAADEVVAVLKRTCEAFFEKHRGG